MQKEMDFTEVDDVLCRFAQSCPLPNPSDIKQWQGDFPDHAAEIAAYARSVIEDVTNPEFGHDETLSEAEEEDIETKAFDLTQLVMQRIPTQLQKIAAKRRARDNGPEA